MIIPLKQAIELCSLNIIIQKDDSMEMRLRDEVREAPTQAGNFQAKCSLMQFVTTGLQLFMLFVDLRF